MVELECDRCGTVFDTDRGAASRHADTSRCPSCGRQHEAGAEAERIASASEPAVAVDGGPVRITITIDVEPRE